MSSALAASLSASDQVAMIQSCSAVVVHSLQDLVSNPETALAINQTSLVEQLKHILLMKIASGEWPPGTRLPAETDLSIEFGISAGTIRKALDFMEGNKFIVRQQGRGTFVMDPADQEIIQRYERFRTYDGAPIEQAVEILTYEEGEATEVERENLRLRMGKTVRRFSRRRRFKGSPFLSEVIALPSDLFPASKDIDNPELWITISARNCGVLLGDVEHRISLAPCPEDAAHLLGRVKGETVMHIVAITLTLDGVPARWLDAHCITDGMYYSVPLSRSF